MFNVDKPADKSWYTYIKKSTIDLEHVAAYIDPSQDEKSVAVQKFENNKVYHNFLVRLHSVCTKPEDFELIIIDNVNSLSQIIKLMIFGTTQIMQYNYGALRVHIERLFSILDKSVIPVLMTTEMRDFNDVCEPKCDELYVHRSNFTHRMTADVTPEKTDYNLMVDKAPYTELRGMNISNTKINFSNLQALVENFTPKGE